MVVTKVQSLLTIVYLNGVNRNGIMSVKAMKKNQRQSVDVTYLSQLGKVLVPLKKLAQTKQKEKPLPRENKKLNTVNQ